MTGPRFILVCPQHMIRSITPRVRARFRNKLNLLASWACHGYQRVHGGQNESLTDLLQLLLLFDWKTGCCGIYLTAYYISLPQTSFLFWSSLLLLSFSQKKKYSIFLLGWLTCQNPHHRPLFTILPIPNFIQSSNCKMHEKSCISLLQGFLKHSVD